MNIFALAWFFFWSFLHSGQSLPFPGPGGVAAPPVMISLVAHVGFGNPNGSGSATSSALNTTGATLLVMSAEANTSQSVSDSNGNSWNGLTEQCYPNAGDCANFNFRMYYVYNPTVGSSQTFTCTGPYAYCTVTAWSGTSTASSVLDAQNGATALTQSLSTGSVTPSTTNELIISAWGANAHPLTGIAVSGGLSILDGQNLSTYAGPSYDAYLIDSGSSAIDPAWSITSAAVGMTATVAAFKHQ